MTNQNKIITFGCRLNGYESEAIRQILSKSENHNLVVFNSCAVTAEAEKQLSQAIRRARRENPVAKIIVTGCAAQIDPKKYAKMDEVNLVLGNREKLDWKSYVANYTGDEKNTNYAKNTEYATHQDKIFFEERFKIETTLNADETAKIAVNDIMSIKKTAPQLVSYFENKTRAFLEIQNGCNHRCTFCIIPFGRGNSRSVPLGEIVETAKKMVALGHKEIVLTGVDISDYGLDLPSKLTLSQMIKRLLKLVPELARLRLSSIDVSEIDDSLLNIIKDEERFMPYLHLSVQSGDDMILKRMKRRHTAKQVIEFCEKARKSRAEITFGADFIAGFPTENDEMFLNSVTLIKNAGIIFNHIFPYSKRNGTPAAKMPQIEAKTIKTRAKILRETGDFEMQKFLKNQIGKTAKVIVEKNNFAKSENFLDIKIIDEEERKISSGEILDVKIISIEGKFLVGKVSEGCDLKLIK
jgi:threonylcarbamoyladenosine tRNA methylthiotransferase MtaB